MPIITNPDYTPHPLLWGAHLQTIVPSLLRRTKVSYSRERMITPDDDFIDLDWYRAGSVQSDSAPLALLLHGLEGSSRSDYVCGLAQALNRAAFDVVAINHRGCSGEPNRQLRSYHSGATDDLHSVLSHILSKKDYHSISLIGFSLSGNIVLKYLGDQQHRVAKEVVRAVAISPPCDLAGSAKQLALRINAIYMSYFLRKLRRKMLEKARRFPNQLDTSGLFSYKTFQEFDDAFTAPMHGFTDAADYWRQCSSAQYLTAIRIPTLILSAKNDPFLSPSCFPTEQAQANSQLYLEIPRYGGHNGFMERSLHRPYWSEKRTLQFLTLK